MGWGKRRSDNQSYQKTNTAKLLRVGTTAVSERKALHVRTRDQYLKSLKKKIDISLSSNVNDTGILSKTDRFEALNDMEEYLEHKGYMIDYNGEADTILNEGDIQVLKRLGRQIRRNKNPIQEMSDYLRIHDYSVRKGT